MLQYADENWFLSLFYFIFEWKMFTVQTTTCIWFHLIWLRLLDSFNFLRFSYQTEAYRSTNIGISHATYYNHNILTSDMSNQNALLIINIISCNLPWCSHLQHLHIVKFFFRFMNRGLRCKVIYGQKSYFQLFEKHNVSCERFMWSNVLICQSLNYSNMSIKLMRTNHLLHRALEFLKYNRYTLFPSTKWCRLLFFFLGLVNLNDIILYNQGCII